MDVLTKEQRHKNMQNIHSKNTSIELTLRKAVWSKGIRYRVNNKKILGKPDISIKKYKLAVFCDGDFWHGNTDRRIETNEHFWNEKIKRNKEHDLQVTIQLRDEGWTVLRFWGSDIMKKTDKCVNIILSEIEQIKKRRRLH